MFQKVAARRRVADPAPEPSLPGSELLSFPSITTLGICLSVAFQIIFFFMLHWFQVMSKQESSIYEVAWKKYSNNWINWKLNALPLLKQFLPPRLFWICAGYELLHLAPAHWFSSLNKSIWENDTPNIIQYLPLKQEVALVVRKEINHYHTNQQPQNRKNN